MLRGYALTAMAINHFGLGQSYLHEVTGRSGFLLSAAEAFLLISGFTLGYISIGRSPEQVTERLSKRTWTVYLATIGISFGLGLFAMVTQFELWGGLDIDVVENPAPWVGQVLTLQAAFNGADILVAYVLYLTAAIAALRLMTAGRSGVVVAAVGIAYLISQIAGPDNTVLGFASFRSLLPNAPLFFGGLLVGYHRHRVNEMWHAVPFHRALDGALVVATMVLARMHAGDWKTWPWLGEQLVGPSLTDPLLLRETEMPIGPLLVVLAFLRVGWLIVDFCWVPIRRTLGWLLLPLGEASLFTFTMHLLAIPAVINLPFWDGDDLGRGTASMWIAAYIGLIYAAVLLRRRFLVWLRSTGSLRQFARLRGPAIAVAGLATLVLAVGAGSMNSGDAGRTDDDGNQISVDESNLREEVGQTIDAFVFEQITVDEVLGLLPPETAGADRLRIAELLENDPWAAENELFGLLVSQL